MKRILFVATSDIHLATFHLPYMRWLKDQGCRVDIAVEKRGRHEFDMVDRYHQLSFPRTLANPSLFRSYRRLKSIIHEGCYDLIHCHTPIPSAIARLAARQARRRGTVVLYTAHGFHFFKGAPLKYWLAFYPAEYLLSHFTDAIITINAEDFGYVNGKMGHKASYYIHGVGVDASRFRPGGEEKIARTRASLGYPANCFILLYIAEFIRRKNHEFILRAARDLKAVIPNLKILFAGEGCLLSGMKKLAEELDVSDVIDFLGFRVDVHRLAAIADVGISSSRQEGLGLGLVEEMLCAVPIVASEDRGHMELVENGRNGFMFGQGDTRAFVNAVSALYRDPQARLAMGRRAYEKAQEFVLEKSLRSMIDIYRKYI